MKKEGVEVSDKIIITLLIVAVIVSITGAYLVYDYSHSFEIPKSSRNIDYYSTGYVTMTVINPGESVQNENLK